MYHLFARAIAFLDAGDTVAACDALKSANEILRMALKYFFSSMVDANLAQNVWLAYVQGYQGWTLGGIDGISGGQSLTFRTLDAFLGIRPFPVPEKESLHLPTAQRNWLNFLREYDIRTVVKARGEDPAITAELEALVKQLRVSTSSNYHQARSHRGFSCGGWATCDVCSRTSRYIVLSARR